MPHLSIKNVPEAIVDKLRTRAQVNHRSLQGELMALVCNAVEAATEGDQRQSHAPEPEVVSEGRSIEEIAAEHRLRRPQPVTEPEPAVDTLRRERDSR